MAKEQQKTWADQEILTHTDLNAEFQNIYTTPMALISPAEATLNMDGNKIDLDDNQDSSIRETADDTIVLELGGFDAIIFDGTTASTEGGLSITTAAEAGDVAIAAQGTATDLGISITPKGAGEITIGNLLSGSWSPAISFDGASVGVTYTTQTGTYSRIGDLVFVQIHLVVSDKGSSSGFIEVSLPIASSASEAAGILDVRYNNWASTAVAVHAVAKPSTATLIFYDTSAGNSTQMVNTDLDTSCTMRITGWYEV